MRSEDITVEAPPVSVPRLVFLDGLRGMAALMVVVYHYWLVCDSPRWLVSLGAGRTVDLLSLIGALGGTRISLFFVLTGFLLYLPFARRRVAAESATPALPLGTTRPQEERFGAWLWRRFRRLAPAYYAVMFLALLPTVGSGYLQECWWLVARHTPLHVLDFGNLLHSFPECLFFLHGMFPGKEAPMWDGPLWTLTPEIQLYFAFPLLIALSRAHVRFGRRRWGGVGFAVVLAVIASIGYRVFLYRQIGCELSRESGGELFSPYHCLVNTFLGRWAEFALGMGAAEWVTQGRRLSPRVAIAVCACALIALVWFVVLRSNLAVGGWLGHAFLASDPLPSPLADAMGGVTYSLMIVCCASLPALTRLFTWRPLVWVGTISYSLYLIHLPIRGWLGTTTPLLLHQYPYLTAYLSNNNLCFALNLLILLPLTLFIARAFWAFFERPFLSRRRHSEVIGQTVR